MSAELTCQTQLLRLQRICLQKLSFFFWIISIFYFSLLFAPIDLALEASVLREGRLITENENHGFRNELFEGHKLRDK